ncbi:MAG: DUF4186 family protein [Ignavibacteriae bacterium]|nr:DUF4186 family protein [Ignavibacteriota bacterium]NOG99281.1 DUF4186 family protein [Ignavibacteriota bacterium]
MGNKWKKVPVDVPISELSPLNVECSSTKCEDDLHCFSRYMKKAEKKFGRKGVCYNCGHDSIDWDRIHQNNINDSKYILESLNKELIRKIFTTIKIEKNMIEKAQNEGREKLRAEARKELKKRIGKYNDFIDGRQTPKDAGNIINLAQHATATCCRQCLEAWFNIPMEQQLTELQLEFCTDLVMLYFDEKVPNF